MVVSASASFHIAGCPFGTAATVCGAGAAPNRARPPKAAVSRENHSRSFNLPLPRPSRSLFAWLSCPSLNLGPTRRHPKQQSKRTSLADQPPSFLRLFLTLLD